MNYRTPRFMTDAELAEHFGIDKAALRDLRRDQSFPHKMAPIGKTDSRAVDHYFDVASQVPVSGRIPDPEPL